MGLENKVEVLIVSDREVGRWKQWKKVISGECIACFVDPLYLSDALEAGLHVLKVPDLQAVGHYARGMAHRSLLEKIILACRTM